MYNTLPGASNPSEITCYMDDRYNARSFHSSQKPEQASSQAYTVAIETMIDNQYIIGLAIENKLCWAGAWMKNRCKWSEYLQSTGQLVRHRAMLERE